METLTQSQKTYIRARILTGINPESPRSWDNVGTIVDWHRRGSIGGDRKPTDTEMRALARGGWDLLARYLRRTEGATVVIPIGCYEHSGITIWAAERGDLRTGGRSRQDSAGWDSGYVGFTYDTKEARERCGTELQYVDEALRGELATLDQYLRGDVYGYIVETRTLCDLCAECDADDDDELPEDCPHCEIENDSCGGFYGDDPAENGMLESVDPAARAHLLAEYKAGHIEISGYGDTRIESEWRAA